MNPKPLIEAAHVALGYGSNAVLRDVGITVRSGEFWFVLGPNGEGKSTLLRSILGLLRPLSGQLLVDAELASRTKTGFVPQRCDINPSLPTTVREFVDLGLVGIPNGFRDADERRAWALEQVDLAGMATKDYWSLSGGQRQRALLARALVRRPALLVLDEPTNGLDLTSEDALLRCIARLNRETGLTVLFVTHDLTLAARYATHIAFVHEGSVTSGPRDDMMTEERLRAIYNVPVHLFRDATGELTVGLGATRS